MARTKPKKEFTYTWIFEAFDQDDSFFQKRMFGGLAAYLKGRMVMVLMESPGEQSYRGKTYDCDLWDGVMCPTEKAYHAELMNEFLGLKPHPVLGKWLYLSAAGNDFETTATQLAEAIASGDRRLGIDPKS